MSRRGRSGPTISLFSFQDIITSVTTIVTVITLLLALDLVQRKQSRASNSSSALAVELTRSLERAEAELDSLRQTSILTDDLVREAAATSPAELRNEIAGRESAITELQREKARLEQQRNIWKSREKDELTEQFDLEPLRDEMAKTERSAVETERQQADEKAENRVIFSLPKGIQKEGWIAVIDAKQIAVAPLGRPTPPKTFTRTGLPLIGSSAADNLAAWIAEQQLGSAYFLLLIRPDGSSAFHAVQAKLDEKTISYGFDVVGVDLNILHPERGAAP